MRHKETIISLFTGAMGLDLGLETAGFEPRVAVETNRSAIGTVKKNRPWLPIINRPIQQVTTTEILEKAGLTKGAVTLVTGGPCCQSFSTVGKRGSLGDKRGTLFRDFCRVVREAQPRFFVMENVRGLLSAAIRHRKLKERGPGFPPLSKEEELGSAFKLILNELAELEYYCTYGVMNAADYGTPQIRHRVIILGSRDGEDIRLPQPTHSKDGNDGKAKWVTLVQALCKVKAKEWEGFSDSQLEYLKLLSAGQNWTSLAEDIQEKALGGAYRSWGGRKGFYRRLSWDRPAPSLTTSPTGKATMLCHPDKNRPLSVEEYARLQEFKRTYIFEGTTSTKYVLIGNAVPLGLAAAIGHELKETMRRTRLSGLPEDAKKRKGLVACADATLAKRLAKRQRTKLEPVRFRINRDPKAAREWLKQVAADESTERDEISAPSIEQPSS